MSESEDVEQQAESLTRLARPGNWPRATDELADNTTFADGVRDERVAFFKTFQGYTRYWIHSGTESADYDYYIVVKTSAGTIQWDAFGYDERDHERILAAFEDNPFMLTA